MICLGNLVIFLTCLLAAVNCQDTTFHMTNMSTVPVAGPNNIVPENQTLQIFGQTNKPWTFCSLYFRDKLLCTNTRGPTCDPSEKPNTYRLGNIAIQQMPADDWCGFQVPNISSLDSGKWKLKMEHRSSPVPDYNETLVMVSTRTNLQLSLSTSEVSTGDTLVANCSATGGLPRVTTFTWEVKSALDSTIVQWNFTYGEVVQDGGVTSQIVSVQPQNIGSFILYCCGSQEGYYSPSIVEKSVLVSAPVDPDPEYEGALDKFTITFIVLGAVFVLVIIIWVIVAAVTGTFCFAAAKPEERREAKKKAKKEDDTIRTDDRNTVVDTKYLVGQDFKDNDIRSSQASESLSLQFQQGRPTGFMSAGQHPQTNRKYPQGTGQHPQSTGQYSQSTGQYSQGTGQHPPGNGQYDEYDQESDQLDESGDSMEPKNFRRQPHLYTGQTRDSLRMKERGYSAYTQDNQHRGALV